MKTENSIVVNALLKRAIALIADKRYDEALGDLAKVFHYFLFKRMIEIEEHQHNFTYCFRLSKQKKIIPKLITSKESLITSKVQIRHTYIYCLNYSKIRLINDRLHMIQ